MYLTCKTSLGPTKSLANAFGKLRVGQKTKKLHAGDFKVENKHDEFIKQSLRKRNENLQVEALQSGAGESSMDDDGGYSYPGGDESLQIF